MSIFHDLLIWILMTLWPNVKFNAQFNTGFLVRCFFVVLVLLIRQQEAGCCWCLSYTSGAPLFRCDSTSLGLAQSCQVLLSHFSAGTPWPAHRDHQGFLRQHTIHWASRCQAEQQQATSGSRFHGWSGALSSCQCVSRCLTNQMSL